MIDYVLMQQRKYTGNVDYKPYVPDKPISDNSPYSPGMGATGSYKAVLYGPLDPSPKIPFGRPL